MSLYRSGKIYWGRIVRCGVRQDRSLRCRSRAEAIRIEAGLLTAIAGHGLPAKSAEWKPVTLAQIQERVWAVLLFLFNNILQGIPCWIVFFVIGQIMVDFTFGPTSSESAKTRM